MFEAILYEMTMIVAQVHESILHLNDNFELAFGDKELHFLVMFALGMVLFFAAGKMEHHRYFVYLCLYGDDRAGVCH